MSLIQFEKVNTGEVTFRKIDFMKLTSLHIVRILNAPSYTAVLHWLNRIPVKCLGDGCPICVQNKSIIADNPETFRKVSTYSRKAQTFYMNVLDRTPAKVCPNCNHENTAIGNRFSAACGECNSLITDVKPTPVNKVKVLSRGVTFGEDLNGIHNSNLADDGSIIGIHNYDVQIMVGSNKQPFPQALLNNNDKVEIDESELFDLESAPIVLEPDEMLDLQRGVSLKDIFAARSVSDTEDFGPALNGGTLEGETTAKIEENVLNLLG